MSVQGSHGLHRITSTSVCSVILICNHGAARIQISELRRVSAFEGIIMNGVVKEKRKDRSERPSRGDESKEGRVRKQKQEKAKGEEAKAKGAR